MKTNIKNKSTNSKTNPNTFYLYEKAKNKKQNQSSIQTNWKKIKSQNYTKCPAIKESYCYAKT